MIWIKYVTLTGAADQRYETLVQPIICTKIRFEPDAEKINIISSTGCVVPVIPREYL